MGFRLFLSDWRKFVGPSLLFVSSVALLIPRGLASYDQEQSQKIISRRISTLIRQSIEQARVRLPDGTHATVMPVLPSDEAVAEIKGYGSLAIQVLAGYLNSKDGLEQHLSLRFLLQFQDEASLRAIQTFAEKSLFAGIRQEAIVALTGFAGKRVRPILERAAKSDPDPDVRAHAGRMLASLRVSPQH